MIWTNLLEMSHPHKFFFFLIKFSFIDFSKAIHLVFMKETTLFAFLLHSFA